MTDGSEQLDGLAEQLGWTDEPAGDAPYPEDAYDAQDEHADGAQPDAETPPARDYEAELAALQTEREAAANELTRYQQQERERQQRDAVEQERQWQQATAQAKNHARTLPYEEAIEFMSSFYAQREQALMQWGTDNFTNLQMQQLRNQAEKLVSKNGLSEADTESLVRAAMTSGDPRAMAAEAERIKTLTSTKDQEISALKTRLERLEKQERRQQRAATNRVGGTQGRVLPPDVKPGTSEHLTLLLGGDDGEFLRRHG